MNRLLNPEEGPVGATTGVQAVVERREELLGEIAGRLSGTGRNRRLPRDQEMGQRSLEDNAQRFVDLSIVLSTLDLETPRRRGLSAEDRRAQQMQARAIELFGSLDNARRFLILDRRDLLSHIGEHASDLSTIDTEIARALVREIDSLSDQEVSIPIVASAIDAISAQNLFGAETRAPSTDVRIPVSERVILPPSDPSFTLPDVRVYVGHGEQDQVLVAGDVDDLFLDLGNDPDHPLTREQLQENASPVVSLLGEGVRDVSRHSADPAYRNPELGGRMADTFEEFANENNPFFQDRNGNTTPEGERFNQAMDLLREGRIQEALEILREFPQTSGLFRQVDYAIYINPNRLTFEFVRFNVRGNIILRPDDMRIYQQVLQGGSTEQRNALFLALFAEGNVALGAVTGTIVTEQLDVTDPNFPVAQVNLSRATGMGQSYGGALGITIADLRQGRPINLTFRMALGGITGTLDEGESVRTIPDGSGGQIEVREPIQPVNFSSFYLGTVSLDVELPLVSGDSDVFRFVSAGWQLSHALSVETGGPRSGQVTFSPDQLLHATVAIGRRGQGSEESGVGWSFWTYVTGAVGIMGSQFGAIESDALLNVMARVNPQGTLRWRSGRAISFGMPISYSVFIDPRADGQGVIHTFGIGAQVRATLHRGLDLYGGINWNRSWGPDLIRPSEGPMGGFSIDTGLEGTPQLWRNVVPTPEETRPADVELTPEMRSGILDAYRSAVVAAESGDRNDQLEAARTLSEALTETIPRGSVLRSGVRGALGILRRAVREPDTFRTNDLERALDELEELRIFRSLGNEIRDELRQESGSSDPRRR